MDSNHRSRRRQIYSLFPLATRETSHVQFQIMKRVEGGGGFEPPKSKTTDFLSNATGPTEIYPRSLPNDEKSGGRWWIRTTEVEDDRFTVCSLWPLGKPPILFISLKNLSRGKILKWSWWTDSNPRPADYKSAALPTELHQLVHFVCRCISQRRCLLYSI